jgi:hypothetical protein
MNRTITRLITSDRIHAIHAQTGHGSVCFSLIHSPCLTTHRVVNTNMMLVAKPIDCKKNESNDNTHTHDLSCAKYQSQLVVG